MPRDVATNQLGTMSSNPPAVSAAASGGLPRWSSTLSWPGGADGPPGRCSTPLGWRLILRRPRQLHIDTRHSTNRPNIDPSLSTSESRSIWNRSNWIPSSRSIVSSRRFPINPALIREVGWPSSLPKCDTRITFPPRHNLQVAIQDCRKRHFEEPGVPGGALLGEVRVRRWTRRCWRTAAAS